MRSTHRFRRIYGGRGGRGDCGGGGGCGEGVTAHDHARDRGREDEVMKHSDRIGRCRHHSLRITQTRQYRRVNPFCSAAKTSLLRQEVELVLVCKRISQKDGTQFECRRENRHALLKFNVDFFSQLFDLTVCI